MEGVGEWGLEASDRPEAEMVRAGAVAGKVMRDLKGREGVHGEEYPGSITSSKFYLKMEQFLAYF